jgi:hypothetical protein
MSTGLSGIGRVLFFFQIEPLHTRLRADPCLWDRCDGVRNGRQRKPEFSGHRSQGLPHSDSALRILTRKMSHIRKQGLTIGSLKNAELPIKIATYDRTQVAMAWRRGGLDLCCHGSSKTPEKQRTSRIWLLQPLLKINIPHPQINIRTIPISTKMVRSAR